jgi:hypothetical protein
MIPKNQVKVVDNIHDLLILDLEDKPSIQDNIEEIIDLLEDILSKSKESLDG